MSAGLRGLPRGGGGMGLGEARGTGWDGPSGQWCPPAPSCPRAAEPLAAPPPERCLGAGVAPGPAAAGLPGARRKRGAARLPVPGGAAEAARCSRARRVSEGEDGGSRSPRPRLNLVRGEASSGLGPARPGPRPLRGRCLVVPAWAGGANAGLKRPA